MVDEVDEDMVDEVDEDMVDEVDEDMVDEVDEDMVDEVDEDMVDEVDEDMVDEVDEDMVDEPMALPDTGSGGLAGGSSLPVLPLALAISIVVALGGVMAVRRTRA